MAILRSVARFLCVMVILTIIVALPASATNLSEPPPEVTLQSIGNVGTPTAVSSGVDRVTLRWKAVPDANRYQVWQSESPNGAYSLITTTSSTSRVIGNLSAGVVYYFKVQAGINIDGKTTYSNLSAAVDASPVGNVGVPNAAGSAADRVTLKWSAVAGANRYQVWMSESVNGSFNLLSTTSATSRSYSGLLPGKAYFYKIRAGFSINGKVYYSNFSSTVGASPLRNAAAPSAIGSGADRVTLSWTPVSGANRYQVWQATHSSGPFTVVSTTSSSSRVISGLTPGQVYYYKVQAGININGATYYSAMSTTTATSPVRAAGIPSVEFVGTDRMRLTWSAVAGANRYQDLAV